MDIFDYPQARSANIKVYDLRFAIFLLDKRSFSIVYAEFRDKNAVFTV